LSFGSFLPTRVGTLISSPPLNAEHSPSMLDFHGIRSESSLMSQVVLQNVCKKFHGRTGEVPAIENLTLRAGAGELLALIGPSGSGKTTLLRLLAGFEQPDAGSISIGATNMDGVPPGDRNVAMVFQDHALYPHLSVRENLSFGLKLRKLPPPEISRRIEAVAAQLGVSELLPRSPETLSGGQAQRVALARALVRQPAVLLLDEPFAHLDAHLRFRMRDELARIHRASGATILYVTHDPSEALALADRIAVLRAGVLQQVATPEELYGWPANTFVAEFIAMPPMNFFRGTIKAKGTGLWFVWTEAGDAGPRSFARIDETWTEQLRAYLDRPVICGLRPEAIFPAGKDRDPSAACVVQAVVERVERIGAQQWLHARIGGRRIIAGGAPGSAVGGGETLPLVFDLQAARFFDPDTNDAVLQNR
jgi:multiple sugar transport system ATP-binding protein